MKKEGVLLYDGFESMDTDKGAGQAVICARRPLSIALLDYRFEAPSI